MLSRMTQAPQQLVVRRSSKRPLIIACAVVAAFAILMIWSLSRPDPGPPTAQPAAVTVDQADVAKYWSENYSATSWFALTATPTWDGAALVARTTLYPDEDARDPSLSICRAMMMYWLARDRDVEPVRVLDQAGNILASGRTDTSSCAWRR